jgi:hypothetical protein
MFAHAGMADRMKMAQRLMEVQKRSMRRAERRRKRKAQTADGYRSLFIFSFLLNTHF